ncbi:MAG: DUF2339 domain-containing protein [Bacteroidetes bacterium]|nr:DUF2339 domain-containing protein [Bacteroidota bacterium]
MENALIFLIGLGILIFLIVIRSEFLKKFEVLNKNLFAIHKQLRQLESKNETAGVKEKAVNFSSLVDTPVKDNSLDLSSQSPVVEIPPVKAETPKVTPKEETPLEKFLKQDILKKEEKPIPVVKPAEVKVTPQPVSEPVQAQKAPAPKSAIDVEKLIGENWLNKIGIGILVIGIGFFVKYAIDKNWIGEWGRLGIGIAAALIMVGIAHWLRKTYHAFSSVLIGGAIATLYYTISIGYHDYKLFSQPVAFSIMTIITLFATVMAIWYNRRELAIIGLVGGFTAPFMVAGETNNAAAFFTYIAILNTGMLVLSFFKKWTELNRLAFVFSALYLTSWILMNWQHPEKIFGTAMTFLILFFVQFLTMNLTYNVLRKVHFNTWEFIHLLGISALFYGSVMYVLHMSGHGDLKGVFTVALGTLFTVLTILFKRIPGSENNLVLLLSGKAVTFLTLTVFIQFDGYYVTLFWALEGVILYWLGSKAKMNLLKNTALLVTGIGTLSLFMVWSLNYQVHDALLPVIFNTAFATGSFVLLCYAALVYLMKKDAPETNLVGLKVSYLSLILKYWFFIVLYLVLLLELVHQCQRIVAWDAQILVIWIFHLVYLAVALVLANLKGTKLVQQLFFMLAALSMVVYVAIGNTFVIDLRDGLFSGNGLNGFYQLHYIIPVLFICMLLLMQKLIVQFSAEVRHHHFFITAASLFGLYLVCAEMDHLAIHQFAETINEKSVILRQTQIAGYTIVWGIYSFLVMILGMRKKARSIRVFALVAFSITLVKLFAFDIRHISEAGKIIAFISLGVMLLVVSFLYQKLKRMIVDGDVGE